MKSYLWLIAAVIASFAPGVVSACDTHRVATFSTVRSAFVPESVQFFAASRPVAFVTRDLVAVDPVVIEQRVVRNGRNTIVRTRTRTRR